ncbi:MAG: cell division protein FtsZ [Candidatus Peribacteraceae bacterium]|nr:cell division protein FtsZ [Candidatus Peribacteraceae bacterium]
MSDTFRSIFSGTRTSGNTTANTQKPADAADGSREVRPDMMPGAVIRVLGAGGGGGNAVNRMIHEKVHGVEFIAVNTDMQALYHNPASKKITIGRGTTKGLGAGANPDVGKKAAEESLEEIKDTIEGTDMLFLTAGLGGGTGSGCLPIIAEAARSMGILTVAVVTKPFSFEGFKRKKQAEEALEYLKGKVDTLITIPNDKILSLIDKTTPLMEAFQVVDEVLKHAIEGISSIITVHGLVNVDFADVKAVMQDAGTALMGIGYGTGDSRAAEAARAAIDSPLLETSIHGAQGVLFNITGGNDLSMFEVDEAARIITEATSPEANVIFGAVIDEAYTGQVKVTVIATGFDEKEGIITPAAANPAQRLMKNTFSRPSVEKAEGRSQPMTDPNVKTSSPQFNEEELEVPAFMRKPLSK